MLIPLIGSQWTLTVLIFINLSALCAIAASQSGLLTNRVLLRQGAMVLGVVVLSFLLFGPHYLDRQLTAFSGSKSWSCGKPKEATFAVLDYDDQAAGKIQQLLVNSKSYANNRPEGRRYMAAMAHYPLLLHRGAAERAVIICIGTGTTVGAVSTHHELQSIDAVDLAPAVFEFARYFVPINNGFHQNPKVRKVAADGRHYLLGTDSFDVITLEPPPPQDAGIVNLYTEEFYALAKQRMRPGAVLAQWAPLDIGRGILPKMILKAMLRNSSTYHCGCRPGWKGSLSLPTNRCRSIACACRTHVRAGGRKGSGCHRPRSPEHLLATFVAADQRLTAYLDAVPSLTDDVLASVFQLLSGNADPHRGAERLREPVERYLVDGSSDDVRLGPARA